MAATVRAAPEPVRVAAVSVERVRSRIAASKVAGNCTRVLSGLPSARILPDHFPSRRDSPGLQNCRPMAGAPNIEREDRLLTLWPVVL
jgi:hypothetical protein